MKILGKLTAISCALAMMTAASGLAARTVVDDNGTEVEIPEKVNRVVVTNILPLASAVTVFLNDLLVLPKVKVLPAVLNVITLLEVLWVTVLNLIVNQVLQVL